MYPCIGSITRGAGVAILFAVLVSQVLPQPSGNRQLYSSMTAEQRRVFVKSQVEDVIGIGPAGAPGADNLAAVIEQIDAFVARKPSRSRTGCRMGADLNTIFRRAKPHVPTITASFQMTQIQPDLGIYIAWAESEFCPCIQAPTGPLGMFQFTTMTARHYGIDAVKGASPAKPDERCNVKAASRGAAIYVSRLLKDFADDPQEILLSVAAYGVGEGGVKGVRREAREALNRHDVGFWELSDFVLNKREAWVAERRKAATGDEEKDADLPRADAYTAFRTETVKYVPRFLAAAIIGRNPRVFGTNAEPLSKSN